MSKIIFEFLVGKDNLSVSTNEARRAILIGEINLLVILACTFYFINDLVYGIKGTSSFYLILIIVSLISFILNRLGKLEAAKHLLLLAGNFTIFLFATSNSGDTGTNILYFPAIIVAFSLFGYRRTYISIAYVLVSSTLFFVNYFTEFSFIDEGELSQSFIQQMYITNYVISLIFTVFVIHFLIKTNARSEKRLFEKQQDLNEITMMLKASQQRYELAITGTNAGLWDWDILKNKIYHAPKWMEMLGYLKDEYPEESLENFFQRVHPHDRKKVEKRVENHLKNRSPYSIEYRIKNKEGQYVWFLDSGKAVYDDRNKPIRMVGSIINVSHRKTTENKIAKQNEMLEKANAELDRFVYITSHDLKAPLLSILGLINLTEISDKKSDIQLYLTMMKERIKSLELFISDIIDYSRNVRVGLIKEEINIKSMVDSILHELLFLDNVDKLNIKINIDSKLKLFSDEKRISVILKNLISNAIKYNDYNQPEPFLEVSSYVSGQYITITVKDNGEGISEADQSKIFNMFFRASEKSSGSGLGLYIVNEMVQKLRGKIEVESEQGSGSQFKIKLPISL